MRTARLAPDATTSIVSLQGAADFAPILRALDNRLGSEWYLEASWTSDGMSLLMIMAVDEGSDTTLTVTETKGGFLMEELVADRLQRVGECQTLAYVPALVARHVFRSPVELELVAEQFTAA